MLAVRTPCQTNEKVGAMLGGRTRERDRRKWKSISKHELAAIQKLIRLDEARDTEWKRVLDAG